jgi:UDP-N-acetylmuramoyl-L-alanyl-D-glutamate--2,6-diaminopimelate ligase
MSIRSIVKKVIPTNLFRKIEPTGHLVEAVLANVRYGFPGRKVRVIGVTGTNGKTTTSFMIHRMLHEAGIKVGLMTTVAYGIGDDLVYPKVHMTTTQAFNLQKRLRDFSKAGVEWVVLETSSHALAQHRVWGVPYEIAVMTNITHDHLEYHGTFERYLDAKRQLFVQTNKHGLRYGVVNADDPNSPAFASSVKNATSYGIKAGDLQAKNIKLTSSGSSYRAAIEGDRYALNIAIAGEFNVYNSLAAVLVGRKIGLSVKQVEDGIGSLRFVEGRMNAIDEGQKFKVIVDFASTPDGFEKFFASVRPLVKGTLVAVFGSAGKRDETKRAAQGLIAGKYADIVIATEEDDRDDDGTKILEQIAEGARKSGKKDEVNLYRIANREEAIGFAMTQVSSPDDMVVLLGKGHEKTIERADGEYPWNESEVARAALQELVAKS